MIATINISNTETKISLVGGQHVKIKNLGNNTVYVSKHENVVAETNGVKSIQGDSAEILTDVAEYKSQNHVLDWYGDIYAICDSDCKIEIETTNNSNFKQVVKGGDVVSSTLDDTLRNGRVYQLGILTSDITLTLPETAISDIEVDFAIADTVYNIDCDYLSLIPVSNAYYQIIFSYDKSLSTWFSSVVSNDYNVPSTTVEVTTDE